MNNIFDDIEKLANSNEFFEDLEIYDNVRIERIISRGQASPENGFYDQDWFEFVIVVQGEAVLEIEGKPERLVAGSWRGLAPHTRHRVLSTSRDPACVWCAVHIGADKRNGNQRESFLTDASNKCDGTM